MSEPPAVTARAPAEECEHANQRNGRPSSVRTDGVALTLGSEQRRGMATALVGSLFCLWTFWFTLLGEPGRLRDDAVLAGATVTVGLCALVAAGALLLDRVGSAGAAE